MKKLLVLLMVLFSICSSVFAESFEDVLKDCKLDRSRWKVVEWFKVEKFVRLYDSQTVTVTGPGQFDAVIMDYYYDGDCGKDSCKFRKNRHYHSEKWGFDTTKATGTLRSFDTRDLDGNVVDSYNYPPKMQIASPLKRNSTEVKTMQKIKEPLKNNKDFAAKESTLSKEPDPSTDTTKLKIGDVDGQWTYIGRYGLPEGSNVTIKEFVLYAQPFHTEKMNVAALHDVYFYHVHGTDLYSQEEGVGCAWYTDERTGKKWKTGYNCVFKLVPLDRAGKPILESGPDGATIILSVIGRPHGPQQIFRLNLARYRTYDAISHQLLLDVKDAPNNSLNRVSQKTLRNGQLHNMLNEYGAKDFGDNMYRRAARMSNCP